MSRLLVALGGGAPCLHVEAPVSPLVTAAVLPILPMPFGYEVVMPVGAVHIEEGVPCQRPPVVNHAFQGGCQLMLFPARYAV